MTIEEVISIAKTLTNSYINVSERITYYPETSTTERVCELDWVGVHEKGSNWFEVLKWAGWKG